MRLPAWFAPKQDADPGGEWLTAQRRARDAGAEIEPPWITFPKSEPWWGGWRQGYSEPWMLEVFLPFWRALVSEARHAYLERWSPPDQAWREYLLERWAEPGPPSKLSPG